MTQKCFNCIYYEDCKRGQQMIEELLEMTDDQAAVLLENLLNQIEVPRGPRKVYLVNAYQIALLKAIKRLRGDND